MSASYEVAIVGAGPAGSALAIRLADRGRSVALVEATGFDTPRIGESLAPGVQPLLRDLDAWDTLLATEPIESFGTKSRWATDEVDVQSHLFSTYRSGWHVDRRALDEGLARLAQRRGATLLLNTTIREANGEGTWWLGTAAGESLSADVLVDATGRRGRIARMLGSSRSVFDHLVGVGRVWKGRSDQQSFVGVEAVSHGWWYSAPLPGDRLITMLMTDADIARDGALTNEAQWQSALSAATLTRQRVCGLRPCGPIRSHAALSARLLRDDVRPWLAVGDAALSTDPLTGNGLVRALMTAAEASDVAEALLRGQHAALEAFETRRNYECHTYLHDRLTHYAACHLTESPFWAKRHTTANRVLV